MEQISAMYEIHAGRFVEPFLFSIIDLEVEIWRNPEQISTSLM
jgi:hypothetical protein